MLFFFVSISIKTSFCEWRLKPNKILLFVVMTMTLSDQLTLSQNIRGVCSEGNRRLVKIESERFVISI